MQRFPALILLLGASLHAQTAVLRGQITDESGAVVPRAKVAAIPSGGATESTVCDAFGAYGFAGLSPGKYTVEATAPDLALSKPANIVLKPGEQVLNLVLTVATNKQYVTVEESGDTSLSTEASNNANAVVLRGHDLDALSDDPDDLQADLQALAGPSAGPNGGAIFVDGFSGGDLPAKNAIREIRINQNPFSPEYDKLGYGRIEIFTKPGTERYHGMVDYNVGTRVWNSRNPYAGQKAPFLLNEFEGGAGGPVGKRASFTVDAQRNMVDNGSVANGVMLNPQSLAASPFSSIITTPQRFFKVSPRIDYQLSQNHVLTVRYGATHANIQDAGIGGFDLPSRGYHSWYNTETAQAAETAVHGTAVNDVRFQYYRNSYNTSANQSGPQILVPGAFNAGGASSSRSSDTQESFEFQNSTSILKGLHSWRFGVRVREQRDDSVSLQNFGGVFNFAGGDLAPVLGDGNQPLSGPDGQPLMAAITSIERYRRTVLFQQLGYSAAQIRALGGGAGEFRIAAGQPELAVSQLDAGLFAGDEWRLRPNVTLNLGLRYEVQSNISDWRDLAPRIAVAWAPRGSARNAKPKTVLRAGLGMFYDRFALANTLAARRYNGVTQQQYVLANPDFFPAVPAVASLGSSLPQAVQEVSSTTRAPYLMQSAFTLERQLPGKTAIAATYTNSHGVHEFRSEDVNAPMLATGAFPLSRGGPVFLMESSGIYNQNQVIANVNTKLNPSLSLFGFYVFNKALSNTDGIGTYPANPRDFSGEYGPASTDVRHRVTAGGSIALRWNVRVSPYLVMQSGAPFDITSGNDYYGTTLYNSRPGFATNAAKPGLVQTSYGLLDPTPDASEALVPRNYGRGPGLIAVNLRIGKAIGFGTPKQGSEKPSGTNAAPAPIGPMTNASLRGLLGSPSTQRRYNLSISMSIRNLLNHTNPGPIVGNITSPLFGSANQVAGAPNGEGFFETASNRRLELQLRLTF
jgi:hypothetical protein